MKMQEAIETLTLALDELIERDLAKLKAEGAADDQLTQERARLEAWRTATLAGVWTKLEEEGWGR
jgi:hypothetical protein